MFINWIIDGWHSIFAPAIVWLNEHVFALIDIEIIQLQVDFIVIMALFIGQLVGAVLNTGPLKQTWRSIALLVFSFWFLAATTLLLPANPNLGDLAQIKGGDLSLLWIIGGAFVLFIGLRWISFEGLEHATSMSTTFGAVALLFSLFLMLELNAHADENLPYVERWLQAWDDIFVEE